MGDCPWRLLCSGVLIHTDSRWATVFRGVFGFPVVLIDTDSRWATVFFVIWRLLFRCAASYGFALADCLWRLLCFQGVLIDMDSRWATVLGGFFGF